MTIAFDQLCVRVDAPGESSGQAQLLTDITAELDAPRIAIIGENGSGKSTLARVLAGLLGYTSGAATVNGHLVSQGPGKAKMAPGLRGRIGMIFPQAAAQVVMPTVEEDIALSLRGSGLSKDEMTVRVQAAMEAHHLTELADRPCLSLSSGQLQRLALCSVLITEPQLVIADEPTSMLDTRHALLVRRRLLHLPRETQLVLVTHDLDFATACDDCLWIHQGRLREHGHPRTVVENYLDFIHSEIDQERI
ncbi:energy-coupling factor ABC transporter ATP-binding protein [Auritidibacter sp. NML100628]|uniref:energy-coupling factor ABC transporter ATP-binding protein n=1 Tax=Auritidibacter sp. NML100628 TaxID=2170742 RepID=UPI000D73F6AD|nr:ABC transporter ATP-binding protein [Auritidibacter sp. NML100628]PXA75675.1 ABC transporter ATP-binding protein [Auritidibacter sp. NML100628]